MNVLIINASTDLYGANRILLQTLSALKPRKIILVVPSKGLLTEHIETNPEFSHVCLKVVTNMPVIFRSMNFKHALQLVKNIYNFRKYLKKIKKEYAINWAYVNTLSSFIIIGILKNLHLKTIVHVHEILENDIFFTRMINKYSGSLANKIIAVSDPVKINLKEANSKSNVVTVLNGISDMHLTETPKNNSLVTVVLFGRIKPEKGIWFFLDAISLLEKQTLSKARFIIVGGAALGGEQHLDKLKKDISLHIAKDNLEFKLFIPDIKLLLNKSDIIVVPSLMKDPFPTTILEASSAGKPVIATNTGGAIQSIKNNVTGYLIDPNDAEKFASCLEALINSEQLRNEMGKAGREFYLENFTIDIFKNNFLKVIENFEATI